jgi:hypothetical protein
MRLDTSVEIPFRRDDVYAVYRDRLVELVKYLPNVREIVCVSRVEEGTTSKMLNRWKGGADIPAVVRKILSEDLLVWDDHALWHSPEFTCEWRTVVPAFKDAVDSSGRNRFEEIGAERTRVVITGDLKVDAAKVKGVPRFLAGTVGPAVEAFLVASVKPNLVSVAKGVEEFLRATKK